MIEKNDILYFFIVVIVAAAIASAITGMTHEPVPLQVDSNRLPVTTYQPAAAPPPAMQTYDPQLVPGSYADTHRNITDNGKFSPAPAPVVVTTAPLPTITPTPTSMPVVTTTCCNNAWNATQSQITDSMYGALNIMGIALVMAGVAVLLYGLMPIIRMGALSCEPETANTAVISGIMALVAGAMIYVMVLTVMPAMMNSIPSLSTGAACSPC